MSRQPNLPASRRERRRQAARRRRDGGAGPAVAASSIPPALAQARQLMQQGRPDEALEQYEQAAAAAPAHPGVLAEAARACAHRFEVDRAQTLLDRLAKLDGPSHAMNLANAGMAFVLAYRPERAMDCLARAVELDPRRASASLELASLYERRGELDQAHAVLERLPAGLAEIDNVRARLARRAGDADRARGLLEPIVQSATVNPEVQAAAGYELARLHDEAGDYAEAWDALSRAKARQRRMVNADRIRQARHRLDVHLPVIEQLTREDLQRWGREQESDGEAASSALLTGLPRSGTTLMLRMLGAHPRVTPADERHVLARVALPGMFDAKQAPADPIAAFDAITPDRLATQRQRYFSLMAQSLGTPIEGLLLDKNPSMLRLLPGVRRLLPQGKLLIAQRDPRDVLVSMLFTFMPPNDVSVQLLAADTAAEHCRAELNAWLMLRDKLDGYHELRYEDLVADPAVHARAALDDLGLPWDDAVLDHTPGGADHVDSPTYEQVAKPVYTTAVNRWRHYEPMLGEQFAALAQVADKLGY